jgi:DNA-binding beta-propeller fold protein YncE
MYQLGDTALLSGSTTEEEGNVTEDDKFTQLDPVLSIGSEGTGPGQFNNPRNVAVAQDGTIYVLDSDNQRVQYFSPSGEYLGMWDAKEQGGFNQPWGIAVSPEGEVFVADTWNHRIMKFSSKGEFLLQWYANDPTEPNKTFYGPRALAVDTMGEIYISDTGNKRILIYSTDGAFIAQFGTAGTGVGELDEPVGIAVWHDQLLAVADTWNQRVQIFDVSGEAPSFAVVGSFDIAGWYSQSLDNKPYLAFDKDGNILVTDPEGYLVMQYSREGKLLRSWNGGGGDIDNFSMPTGITVDSEGAIWVVDTANDRVNKFVLPAADTEQDQLNNEKQ